MLAIPAIHGFAAHGFTADSDGNSKNAAKKYSPAVEQKAVQVLEEFGLRRSGKLIQATQTNELSKRLSTLTRRRKDLRDQAKKVDFLQQQLVQIQAQLRNLTIAHTQLSGQLAQVAGNNVVGGNRVAANNRLVGLISVNQNQQKLLRETRQKTQTQLDQQRSAAIDVQSEYATEVMAVRDLYDAQATALEAALKGPKLPIAINVMVVNHGVRIPKSSADFFGSVKRRLETIEKDVFRESIPLEAKDGSFYATVHLGNGKTRMVVDTGATVICLPYKTANELGVAAGPDTQKAVLTLADGRKIPAAVVTLDKVRVGGFEAENVQAAILDPVANNAEPLLGMSFLKHFRSELDTSTKTLKLSRVQATSK